MILTIITVTTNDNTTLQPVVPNPRMIAFMNCETGYTNNP
ncbi:Uncharacterised protein [Metamycoplasma alkalescens]|uniref:Uncharacterized protein n=1 Tax=Metamycoplasma alkalescens TaxID=45363 RepID=A0A3B0P2F2_9BACT|nr:Uncharacterised protein [Metamycoplasma alkalescens]